MAGISLSRGGGTAMRPATQASGTEGTETGDPASPHAGAARVPLPCLFPTANRGTRGGEGVAPASGKFEALGRRRRTRGARSMESGREQAPRGACNAMPTKGRRTCAMGLVVGGLLLLSLVPHGD